MKISAYGKLDSYHVIHILKSENSNQKWRREKLKDKSKRERNHSTEDPQFMN